LENSSEQQGNQSQSRIKEVIPNEVKSVLPNEVKSVLPRRKPGRPRKNGPKDGECFELENSSEQQGNQSQSRIKEVIPNEVKSVLPRRKPGRPRKYGPKEVIPNEVKSLKGKQGRPFKNGPKDGKSLESEKPSEKHEEKSQSTIDAALNEVKPAADNIMTTVEEASARPKRKRGRPSKWSLDLASQGNKQSLSGKQSLGCKSGSMPSDLSRAPQVQNNGPQIQRSDFSASSDAVPTNTLVADVNLTFADVETMESPNRKKMHLLEDSPDFPSLGQQQGLLDRSKGSMLSQCREGCLKGSDKIPDSKEKVELPDSTIMAIERVSDDLSGAELDDNCDKLAKIIEKNPPGDQKLSTEN